MYTVKNLFTGVEDYVFIQFSSADNRSFGYMKTGYFCKRCGKHGVVLNADHGFSSIGHETMVCADCLQEVVDAMRSYAEDGLCDATINGYG